MAVKVPESGIGLVVHPGTEPPGPEHCYKDGIDTHCGGASFRALKYTTPNSGAPWSDPSFNAALDTEELAVRLLPDLKRPSLARVATALGLAQPVRHRALADARLTAQVLLVN